MENQLPASTQTQGISPKQKFPKYLLFLLIFFLIIVVGEGVYYLYLGGTFSLSTGKKEKETVVLKDEKPVLETRRFFEGLRYYEENNGIKRLLAIEGIIDEINMGDKTVKLQGNGATEVIQYTDSDIIYLITFDSKGLPSQREELLSDLQVTDMVAYNPADEALNRQQAIWNIQKK
ncbi:hypothetical protein COT75_03530 [Candidatus Beckwithbacteria bacterium CG10_big_fil_rev_8_21_14_0_10_34_10]|uniref:Uncharacterized protein n=1 Tax=Candidatus Beckwithbacteria bacterium CG10_big_fil_rev_8_21_14_0_10_34_10 TaxID=1974495 RepID=A0A2H0W8Q6_9BACT|nr:MAG: hypothetical protein COT75_03530 [Candidatus Beckwithbacteria bacterium CG10_big_fil_rev_8_21_14_0_10_34_10]